MHRDNYRGKEGGEEIIQARPMENIRCNAPVEISAQSMYPSDELLEEMNTSMHKNLHNLRRWIINHRWHYDTFAFICRKTLLCFMHCVKSVFATRYAPLSLSPPRRVAITLRSLARCPYNFAALNSFPCRKRK